MYKKTKKGWSKHFDFMLSDLIGMYISFVAAYFLRYGFWMPSQDSVYKYIGIALFIIHILLVFFMEPYNGILRRGILRECKAAACYNMMVVGGIFAYMFITQQTKEVSRFILVLFWIFSIAAMSGSRLVVKKLISYRLKNPKFYQHMLLITEIKLADKMVERIQEDKYSNTVLEGIVITDADMTGKTIQGIPVVANTDTMLEYCRVRVVDEVMLTSKDDWADEVANQLVNMGIAVHISLEWLSSRLPNCFVEQVNGFPAVTTCIREATDRQLLLKRMMDIIGSIFGLLVCGIAFLFVAPIIYIQSPGPIFFSQTRVGKNGRKFQIYKFRSMYIDAEERKKELMEQNEMQGFMFKVSKDPRIFPFGRIMRSLSIDELPQFFNVLKGDMSLIGTRPPTVDEYEQYDLAHKSRLAAKPGITGMWQVSGRSDITDFDEVVKLDNEYIRNWGFGLDLKILCKTFLVVLERTGSK